MRTIYVNDVAHELCGRDLMMYRQLHGHDDSFKEQELWQTLKKTKETATDRDKWLTDILKKAYGDWPLKD